MMSKFDPKEKTLSVTFEKADEETVNFIVKRHGLEAFHKVLFDFVKARHTQLQAEKRDALWNKVQKLGSYDSIMKG